MCRQLRQCWPFERKRTRCIVCVSFILILGLVIGISIGSNAIAQSKRPITLLHRERVTPGETYQIELNNQSDAQGVCMSDLCSTRSCSQVTLTIDIDPTSIQFTGELDASCCKLDLEKTNTLIAMLYNHTIKDTKSYSDWVFHLHCGSTLNITLCAEATGPECHDTEKYNFVIIQGEKNFSLWSSGRDFLKYTKNFITLETIADCRSQSATLPLYTYSENADYYHVIRNSATHDCDIRVFVHAIFERKQYLNKKATPCTVGNDNPSCPKYTASAKYVTVQIDIDTKMINWSINEQVSFSLTCNPTISSDELEHKAVPAFLVPPVSIGSAVILCFCIYTAWRKWHGGEQDRQLQVQDRQEQQGLLQSGQV